MKAILRTYFHQLPRRRMIKVYIADFHELLMDLVGFIRPNREKIILMLLLIWVAPLPLPFFIPLSIHVALLTKSFRYFIVFFEALPVAYLLSCTIIKFIKPSFDALLKATMVLVVVGIIFLSIITSIGWLA